MKNAAVSATSEKAKKARADFAALFYSPEFDTMASNANEHEKGNAHRKEDRIGGSLGYPSGFVPNRDVVNVFRRVLEESGETAKDVPVWSGSIAAETAQAIFKNFNSDKEADWLFNRVFPVAKSLGIKFSLEQYNGYNNGKIVLGDYQSDKVRLLINSLVRTDPQTVASTLLHETIHGVTVYAMEVYSGDTMEVYRRKRGSQWWGLSGGEGEKEGQTPVVGLEWWGIP